MLVVTQNSENFRPELHWPLRRGGTASRRRNDTCLVTRCNTHDSSKLQSTLEMSKNIFLSTVVRLDLNKDREETI